MRHVLLSLAAIAFLSAAFAQGMGGEHKGRRMEFGPNNAPGWTLMTPEERQAHRDKMHSFKTMEECQAYHAEHVKQMQARAQEKKLAFQNPPTNPCDMMKRRGMIQ